MAAQNSGRKVPGRDQVVGSARSLCAEPSAGWVGAPLLTGSYGTQECKPYWLRAGWHGDLGPRLLYKFLPGRQWLRGVGWRDRGSLAGSVSGRIPALPQPPRWTALEAGSTEAAAFHFGPIFRKSLEPGTFACPLPWALADASTSGSHPGNISSWDVWPPDLDALMTSLWVGRLNVEVLNVESKPFNLQGNSTLKALC